MTDEQIKTVEKAISEPPFTRQELHDFKTAATDLLTELHEMRELLEAAGRIELNGDGVDDLGTLERDWDEDSNFWIFEILGQRFRHDKKERFDSALDAYREVKEKGNESEFR